MRRFVPAFPVYRRVRVDRKSQLAVIGSREDVLPFRAIGAEAVITDDVDEAIAAIRRFAREGYPVIFIGDTLMGRTAPVLVEFSSSPIPCITAIPREDGTSPFSDNRINSLVKQAIGIDMEGLH